MKINSLIPIAIILGIIVLFFFPEPETNFLAYFGTALFFIVIVILLVIKSRRKSKNH